MLIEIRQDYNYGRTWININHIISIIKTDDEYYYIHMINNQIYKARSIPDMLKKAIGE